MIQLNWVGGNWDSTLFDHFQLTSSIQGECPTKHNKYSTIKGGRVGGGNYKICFIFFTAYNFNKKKIL